MGIVVYSLLWGNAGFIPSTAGLQVTFLASRVLDIWESVNA